MFHHLYVILLLLLPSLLLSLLLILFLLCKCSYSILQTPGTYPTLPPAIFNIFDTYLITATSPFPLTSPTPLLILILKLILFMLFILLLLLLLLLLLFVIRLLLLLLIHLPLLLLQVKGRTDSVNKSYHPKSARRVEIFNDTEYLKNTREAKRATSQRWSYVML